MEPVNLLRPGILGSFSILLLLLFLPSCGDGFLPENTSKGGAPAGAGMLDDVRELSPLGVIPASKPTIPVRWSLTDLHGRSLDATIVGKNESAITLIRSADGKRFDLAVAQLSEQDRKRVNELGNKTAPSRHPMESSFYRMGQRKLDEIDDRIVEANATIEATNSEIKRRSAYSELRRLQAERFKVVEQLREIEGY